MSNHLRPNRLNVDLQDYKQAWIAYCARHQVTPSQAFRQIVAKLIAAESNAAATPILDANSANQCRFVARVEVRLSATEQQAAQAMAQQEGFSLSRWIAALVRARLEATPQLGQRELELLARSSTHILALGRSLSQIVRVVHARPEGISAIPAALVEGTRQAILEHTGVVKKVLAANQRRWSNK